MKILINERLSEHRCKTPEGYLICTDAILARTGKQTYRKNEIFKDSDDETEIEVDRTEDEVFSPQTLASFENKPVTVEHPDEDVNVHNYKEYAVGFVRDVHRGEVNGQPVILGNLVITDEQTIQEIENGEHTDLSCGYDCDIVDEPNPCQRNIRGNHVALCEQGRAGIARIVDSTCDANHLPAKVKRDLQKFFNHKSTFISNKDYDIAEFVKEFERVSRLWAEFPLKIVRESIKGWFKTGDGMMRKDYVFSIEGYDDRFMVSIYAKPETYETTELNAYFTDSVKDTRMKVANLTNGYAIVPASEWRKFGLNSEVERFTTNLDEARYIRSSLERNDGISFVIVDVTQRRTTDSMKDALIPPAKEAINSFESLLRTSNIEIERKGLTMFGRVHYQVRAFMPFNQFVKKLDRIDNEMNKLGIPMTFNAGADGDGDVCTAGIDLDKQYIKDAIHDSLKDDVARILKPFGLTYTVENALFAWNGVLIRGFEFGNSKDAKLAFNALQSELSGKYKPRLVQNMIQFSESYNVKLKEKLLNDIKSAGGKDVKLFGSEFGDNEVDISIEVSNTDDIADIVNKLSKIKNYRKVEQKKVFGGKVIISAIYNYTDLYKLIHDSTKAQKTQNAKRIQDSKERLFTVKYKQGDTTYIHKVRASSIEDAISKVKDDDDINKLQQLIAETLSARADAWRNDKQKEIRQAKENIANAIDAEQSTRRDIKEFHTLPEYVRRIAEKKARSELKQYDYLLNIQNKTYEKYSSLMREAESLAKTIEAKYNVKLNLELNRSGGEREAIRILKTMRK